MHGIMLISIIVISVTDQAFISVMDLMNWHVLNFEIRRLGDSTERGGLTHVGFNITSEKHAGTCGHVWIRWSQEDELRKQTVVEQWAHTRGLLKELMSMHDLIHCVILK